MTYRQFEKHGQTLVCSPLVLHRTADGDVFITITPVIWQTLGDTLWSFGNHEEMKVIPPMNHQPCVFAPCVSFLNEEIRSEACPHERAGWNLPVPLSVTTYGEIEAGSRSFNDYALLREHCLSILQEKMKTHKVIIVSGHARGADSLGERFANEFRLPFELHPAKWRLLGKAAGMVRNVEMAKCSDALIAFWDGKSRGTGHMIKFARRNGLDISLLDYTRIKAGNIAIESPLPSKSAKQPLDDIKQKMSNTSPKR